MNLAANVLFGVAFALATRQSEALRRELISWQVLFLLTFEAVIFTPVATFLFRFYPQWSMLYAFDPQLFPELDRWIGVLSGVVVLLNFAGALTGFFLARESILRESVAWWAAPAAAGGLILLTCFVAFAKRIVLVGDYDAYWQGTARMLLLRPPGWAGVLLYGSLIAFVRWVHVRFGKADPTII